MLKRIALSDLQTGMFVHKFDGSWFDHPFWRARFLVEDEKKLKTLKSSHLRGVIIDTDRGRDVIVPERHGEVPVSPSAAALKARLKAIRKREPREEQPVVPTSMEQELNAAQGIADRAKDSLSRTFIAARLGKAINVRAVEPVVNDILASIRRNPQAFSGLMRCKLRNEVMFGHALAVSALMVSLARQMKLSAQEIHYCGLAGVLLDTGVNYLPQSGDTPADALPNADPKIWQQHVVLGYRSLQNAGTLPDVVLDACLQHHERLDGTGYPKGLEKGQITLIARMAAICDTFDFLLTGTGHAAPLDPAAAIEHMRTMEGAFDEDILRQFIESVGLYPVGSFVELRSGKLAMVIDEDREEHTQPVVQAFYSLATGERIIAHRIELARCEGDEAIVGIADLTGLGPPDDAQLRELILLSTFRNTA